MFVCLCVWMCICIHIILLAGFGRPIKCWPLLTTAKMTNQQATFIGSQALIGQMLVTFGKFSNILGKHRSKMDNSAINSAENDKKHSMNIIKYSYSQLE